MAGAPAAESAEDVAFGAEGGHGADLGHGFTDQATCSGRQADSSELATRCSSELAISKASRPSLEKPDMNLPAPTTTPTPTPKLLQRQTALRQYGLADWQSDSCAIDKCIQADIDMQAMDDNALRHAGKQA